MGRDFVAPPATSQIVSVVVATGARRELTTGPGRKFSPRWLGANRIAYLFGDADPLPGTRERVIPAAARIAFTDGADVAHWSLYQRELVDRRPADRVSPCARRGVATRSDGVESGCRHSRWCEPASSRRTRATVAGFLSNTAYAGHVSQQHHGGVAGRR